MDFVKLERSPEDRDLLEAVRDIWRRDSLTDSVPLRCEDGNINLPVPLLPLILPCVSLPPFQQDDLVILTPSITRAQLTASLDLLLTGESSAVDQSLAEVEELFRVLGITSVQIELVQQKTEIKSKPKLRTKKNLVKPMLTSRNPSEFYLVESVASGQTISTRC